MKSSHSGDWKPIRAEGAPSAGVLQTAVFDGDKVLIWGGSGPCTDTGACGDGAAYDPKYDRFTRLATAEAPSARYLHAAVWTGRRMLIWGGVGCGKELGSPCGDGAGYDPKDDQWAPLGKAGAPSPRGWHKVAWTGKEMLVWGGEDPLHRKLLGDGARYDPEAGSWRAMSVLGAPSPRRYFSAVWTGKAMIVWGGGESATKDKEFGDGASYDPVKDVWTAVSTDDAPTRRWAHTAVWTGEEMIVWGGLGCGGDPTREPGFCGDGARYDPEKSAWTAIAASGAPSARSGHSAVWTGKEMIVWGGAAVQCADGSSGACGDGAGYDPVTDGWMELPTAPPPAARSDHTAVWMGNAMLVFGGIGAGGSEAARTDGALFVP